MNKLNWQCCSILLGIVLDDATRVLIRQKKYRESIQAIRIGTYWASEKAILIDSGNDEIIETEYLHHYEFVLVKEIL